MMKKPDLVKKIFSNNKLNVLFLFIITLSLYWQTTGFEFVLDDKIVISENEFVKNGISGIKDIFSNESMTGYFQEKKSLLEGGRYRPLSLVFFAVEYELFKLNPFYYHLLNILYYFICAAVLYFVLIQIFENNDFKFTRFAAFLSSAIFILHPIHIEAVANVKGRDEILAFIFSFLSLFFYIKYFDTKRFISLLLSLLAILLAILSKENSIAFIVIIPLTLYFFKNQSLANSLKTLLILFIPLAIYFLIRINALGTLFNNELESTEIMNNPYLNINFLKKISTIAFTILIYMKLLVFPHPLTHDYYPYQIPILELTDIRAIISFTVILALLVFSIYQIKRKNIFSYLILFFGGTIFIVSNLLVNVGTFMNERFLFMPSFVLPVFTTWFLVNKYQSSKNYIKLLSVVVIFLIITGFVSKSVSRIPVWKNSFSLNKVAVEVSENSARAHCFYGVELFKSIDQNKDFTEFEAQLDEANFHIDKALEIYPEYGHALVMKAGIAPIYYKYDRDLKKLLDTFTGILDVKDIDYIYEYTKWLVPRSDKTLINNFIYNAGYQILAAKHRNFAKALNYLQLGYNSDPTNKDFLFGLCILNYQLKNYSESINFGNQFIQHYGENADILYYLGSSQVNSGFNDAGQNNIEKAYKLKPELKNHN